MSDKQTLVGLIEASKAANLPKTMPSFKRKAIFDSAKQAQGWINSSFYAEGSRETKEHIDRLASLLNGSKAHA